MQDTVNLEELEMLKASSVWEDAVYNLTREVKTLRVEGEEEERRFEPRTPAMAAGLTDHIWSIKELLWTIVSPIQSTQYVQTTSFRNASHSIISQLFSAQFFKFGNVTLSR